MRFRFFLAIILQLLGAFAARAQPVHALREAALPGGRGTMKYALILPEPFDPVKPVPVLLALPPGDQSEAMMREGLKRYWSAGALRGWAIVAPIAPPETDFATSDSAVFAPLLEDVRKQVLVRGGKFHLAGPSNGGRAALHLARLRPDWFASVLVLPGFLPSAADEQGLEAMRGVNVAMLIGSADTDWLGPSRRTRDLLRAAGVRTTFTILEGQGHVLDVTPDTLFTMLEEADALADPSSNLAKVSAALDDLHDAAAKADEARYFRRFSRSAVFLGTDATERWTKAEFQTWARPYFARGRAWVYTPRDRHVFFSADGATAWFDEFVDNEKLGACRGTGVLVLEDGEWRIAQYHLVIPVPNDLATDLVKRARDLEKKAATGEKPSEKSTPGSRPAAPTPPPAGPK